MIPHPPPVISTLGRKRAFSQPCLSEISHSVRNDKTVAGGGSGEAVAVGRDYQDIASTSGFYLSTSASSLDLTVSVVIEAHGATDHWLSPEMIYQNPSGSAPHDQ